MKLDWTPMSRAHSCQWQIWLYGFTVIRVWYSVSRSLFGRLHWSKSSGRGSSGSSGDQGCSASSGIDCWPLERQPAAKLRLIFHHSLTFLLGIWLKFAAGRSNLNCRLPLGSQLNSTPASSGVMICKWFILGTSFKGCTKIMSCYHSLQNGWKNNNNPSQQQQQQKRCVKLAALMMCDEHVSSCRRAGRQMCFMRQLCVGLRDSERSCEHEKCCQ